ncbi:MAG TPA: sporulation protein YqfC [Clostridia bacterium]|nr:sporulation protein YqfC [Clostridia bacterium]
MARNNAKKKKLKGNKEENNRKKGFREKLTEMLELPKELVLNIPRITMVGNGDMMIENYKGLVEYGRARIRISTGPGTVKITGIGLVIREITSEDIIISGNIHTLEFLYASNDMEHTG